jgi:hypothetical protein
MTNPRHETALLLAALDHPLCLCAGKNPGFYGKQWDQIEWTEERIDEAFRHVPKLNVGYKLGPAWANVIDIEQDSEQAATDWRKYTSGVELPTTPSWPSKRGSHSLWTLTDEQFNRLRLARCTSVHKIGDLEFRLGAEARTIQSVIPPSMTDGFTRQWGVAIFAATIAPLPAVLFERLLVSAINEPTKHEPTQKTKLPPRFGNRPGDIYNQRATWAEILEPLGWSCVADYGDVKHWCRPGKSDAISATTGFCSTDCRPDCFYIFSTSDEIEPFTPNRSYSKFEAYGLIHHRLEEPANVK